MKRLLFIVLISVLSFSQTFAQSSKNNIEAVSTIEQQTVVMFQVKSIVEVSTLALNKRAFKNKINLKLKGQIDLFRINFKRVNNLC